MGLRRTKTLDSDDRLALTDAGGDLSDIPTNELYSFHNADLLMEALDADGQACYIAVEISFTANGRDTRRAVRNVEFLRRFTGQAAYAAVAGLQMDDRIASDLAAGRRVLVSTGPGRAGSRVIFPFKPPRILSYTAIRSPSRSAGSASLSQTA